MQAVVGRAAGDHPLQHVDEIGLGVETVEPSRVQERGKNGPGLAPAFVAGEQRVLFSD